MGSVICATAAGSDGQSSESTLIAASTELLLTICRNGRVSPRKYSQSDKGAISPAHLSSGTTSTGRNETSGQNHSNPIPNEAQKDSEPGNIPAKIEEGEEPPHPSVLPT